MPSEKRRDALVVVVLLSASVLGGRTTGAESQTPQTVTCSQIYSQGGWAMRACVESPPTMPPMSLTLDGSPVGPCTYLEIYHQSQGWPGTPAVAVLYASGFTRLKPGADPVPPIPFGTSFVLGPAYWAAGGPYYHNPTLTQLEIDTSWLPMGPLRMHADGTNGQFSVAYDLTMPAPRDRQTRLHVTQRYEATAAVSIDAARRDAHEGFKLVQFSSMFVSESGPCDFGNVACHDSNAARFIGSDGARRQTAFGSLTLPGSVFPTPAALGDTWVDALHTDDEGWQGNTPNARIALDVLPQDHTVTPQGWIAATTNPNDDNVGLWLHDDGPASIGWSPGQSAEIGYWLLAQDDPPDPTADLGLRPGTTFLDFEGTPPCFAVVPGPPVTASIVPVGGTTDSALELRYDLGSANGSWAQVRCNFDPPVDLSAFDHLRLGWRGSAAANSLQVALVNPRAGGGENIFARGYHHATHHDWWGQLVVPFGFLEGWTQGAAFDPSQVSAFFLSVVKDPLDDPGGAGRIAIDDVGAFNVVGRPIPSGFVPPTGHVLASAALASWLASAQQPTGLLRSWQQEAGCVAHTYDQALALLVFQKRAMWAQADALVDALVATQNADGSWYKSRDCVTLAPVHTEKWEGDVAWVVLALNHYLSVRERPCARFAARRAAQWLASLLDGSGCLLRDHTEGTIDVWWALRTAGPGYASQAAGLRNCLLSQYWDDVVGRFKGGRTWYQPYLDNQTWGAAFLKAIGEEEKARRALSYACRVLRVPDRGGALFGFDGQGGPWSVWNEGTGQYVAEGGEEAADIVHELLAQINPLGGQRGSPDDFSGGGVWTTRWSGVAPTAWSYFAINGSPLTIPGTGDVVFADGFDCAGGAK